jgi:ABC-type branched-subunit amino acid transport system substrate-binding protein
MRGVRRAVLCGAASLVLVACSGTSASVTQPRSSGPPAVGDELAGEAVAGPTPEPMTAGVPLYLVDTNTNNVLGESLPVGLLTGVKGTIPGAEISQQFKERLLTVDPDLQAYSYAAEAYDAVILAALGAATAQSDAGIDVARQLVPITNGEQGCSDYADCLALIQDGVAIDYNGRSGAVNFSPAGDPTSATIGIYEFGPDNTLLPDVTYQEGEILPEGKSRAIDAVVQKGAGDGVFRIASFLPASGGLAFLGPPETAGIKLAIADIEAAGGIPGFDAVELIEGDSGDTSTDTGRQTVKALLPLKPDVLIGAASSSSTLSVLDQVTNAGVLMISPANTLPSLTTVRDHGLFWRTAPSDVLEGAFLGSLVTGEGHRRVAIISRRDTYGESLRANVTRAITSGGGQVVAGIEYDPAAQDFAAAAATIKAARPDAIVLIGAYESSQIITELVKQGIGPNSAG